ncbi:hypothetical protein [Arvimicrobium flavum]|uniref:hypothetical protein n=1 Tax=Arvimicrobium flavum TaxID=3393320 RepID=UPI00237AD13D|nr:hypothetical protein [Mesorhizobium shangrilense]
MTMLSYAKELEDAAERIADISSADLQIILRRAALRIRNSAMIPLDPEWNDALDAVAGEIGVPRNEVIRSIVKDWLAGNGYLPARIIDEDSATDGSA